MPDASSNGMNKNDLDLDLDAPTPPTDVDEAEKYAAESPLASLVRLRDQIQRLRIAESHRTNAAEKAGRTQAQKTHHLFYERLRDMEEDIAKHFIDELKPHPVWPWLSSIKGVGPALAAQILAEVDRSTATTVSGLWSFAGLGVIQSICKCLDVETGAADPDCPTCGGDGVYGHRQRMVKGEKRSYNARLKTVLYRWAINQLKNHGPYEKLYRDARARYTTSRPKWTEAHRHLAALRVAEKVFMSHLFEVKETLAGRNPREEWIQQYGQGHTHLDPHDFLAAFEAEQEMAKEAKKAAAGK